MGLGGATLKLFQTLLYALEFCCAAIILGIYSYFLSVLADRNAPIYTWAKAVEGMSGAAVLYLIFAVLLTCFLGGKTFFAFIAIVLNLLFCGAFVAIAVLTRDGAHSCKGNVSTPLGNGPASSKQGFGSNGQGNQITYAASLGTVCRLNTACFAVAILGALLFLLSAIVQIFLARHHKKEKRFGPGPKNNYTTGSGKKFWQRNKKQGLQDPEMAGTVPASGLSATPAVGAHDYRPSHDTAYTGSTVTGNGAYDNSHKPMVGGYHTAPQGTYNNSTSPQGTFRNDASTNHTSSQPAFTNHGVPANYASPATNY